MKIRLTYYEPIIKEVEMTPQEYCLFHADSTGYYPDNAIDKDYEIIDDESVKELDDFFWRNK